MTRSAMDWDNQKGLDDEHARNPVPGDYWHEMLVPICVVTKVSDEHVWICRTTIDVDRDHWMWDMEKIECMPRAEFEQWLSYSKSELGCWAHVKPMWFAASIRERSSGYGATEDRKGESDPVRIGKEEGKKAVEKVAGDV